MPTACWRCAAISGKPVFPVGNQSRGCRFCSSRYGLFLLSPENGSYSLRQLDLDAGTLSLSTVVWSVLSVILLLALLLLLARCHKRAELLRRFRRDVLRYSELPLQRFERLVGLRLLFVRKFRTRLNETETRWNEWVAHCRDWRRLMKGSEYSLTAEKRPSSRRCRVPMRRDFRRHCLCLSVS